MAHVVATNNQDGGITEATLGVVQTWAHMPNQPRLADTLQVLWAAFDGNAAYYVPPDTTGATLLAQDMNVQFPALNLRASDLDPAGKIVTVGDLVNAV
jgi:hypothetical protein